MEVRERFNFYKLKWCNKVLGIGLNTTKLGTRGKDNCHKEIKFVIIIHVDDNIYMWFWCFWVIDSYGFDKMKTKGYVLFLIVCGCSGYLFIIEN